MNCKDGDLAIIVRSADNPEFIGSILRVADCHETEFGAGWMICDNAALLKRGFFHILDQCLRTIRDSDKQDEMLSIVNLKEKVKS